MGEDQLLSLCGGCSALAAESRYLGLQFASVGRWKLRVVAVDCQGPLPLLGETPAAATPIEHLPLKDNTAEKNLTRTNDRGLTAFFVHGGGGRAGQFRHLIHFLAQRGVRCIAPDLPGHGVSRLPSESPEGASVCSLEDTQNIVKATFDALAGTTERGEGKAPRRRAVLVGHSFGCLQVLRLYAQLAAENRAEEVAAVCLIGGDVAQRPPGKASWLMLRLPRVLLHLLRSVAGRISQRLLYCKETRVSNKHLLKQEQEITSRNPFETVLQILAHLQGGAAHKDFQKAAAVFRQRPSRPPVLLLYGEEDSVTPPASSAASLAASLGAGPMPSTLPSPRCLGLPYTACSAASGRRGSSSDAHASPKDWARQGAVTATLVGRAGHNVMLEQPLETNHVLWEFVKQQFPQ